MRRQDERIVYGMRVVQLSIAIGLVGVFACKEAEESTDKTKKKVVEKVDELQKQEKPKGGRMPIENPKKGN